jgi:hypothetical protein
MLAVPFEGSVALVLVAASLHLFATTAMGILMATLARTRAGGPRAPSWQTRVPVRQWGNP